MTLPKSIRDEMGLNAGDRVELVTFGHAAIIVPRNKPVESAFGLLSKHAIQPSGIEDYDKAVRDAVADHLDASKTSTGKKDDAA